MDEINVKRKAMEELKEIEAKNAINEQKKVVVNMRMRNTNNNSVNGVRIVSRRLGRGMCSRCNDNYRYKSIIIGMGKKFDMATGDEKKENKISNNYYTSISKHKQ